MYGISSTYVHTIKLFGLCIFMEINIILTSKLLSIRVKHIQLNAVMTFSDTKQYL